MLQEVTDQILERLPSSHELLPRGQKHCQNGNKPPKKHNSKNVSDLDVSGDVSGPVVRHAILAEVVRADPLRLSTRAHLYRDVGKKSE